MPLQRRLPKIGFHSMRAHLKVEVRVHELARLNSDTADLAALKNARLIPKRALRAKIIASGTLDKPIKVKGLAVTPGARQIIEAAGGSVE